MGTNNATHTVTRTNITTATSWEEAHATVDHPVGTNNTEATKTSKILNAQAETEFTTGTTTGTTKTQWFQMLVSPDTTENGRSKDVAPVNADSAVVKTSSDTATSQDNAIP